MTERATGSIGKSAVIIGAILILLNCYWIVQCEVVRYTHLTLIVPFPNVIFSLLIVTAASLLLRRLTPRFSLDQGNLLVIYVMLSIASAIASIDTIQVLVSTMGHAFWFNTPENEWEELFWRYLPRWLLVSDQEVLTGYYKGESSIYSLEYIKAWLFPILWWLVFILVLLFVMLCINVLLRRQWTERERLTYPIIQLPLAATDNTGWFFKNKLMWIGFAIAAGISIINALNYFYPSIPQIPVKRRSIGYLFSERPWNAMGNVQLSFYPFVIGISFMIPLDLLFSAWVFYWLYKAQQVVGSMVGLSSMPRFPYYNEQAFGAFIGICIFVFWSARSHFRRMLGIVFGRGKQGQHDSSEPLPYRVALLGIIGGGLFLYVFSYRAGMSPWAIPVFFCLYFLLGVFVSRMRAELGFLVHNFSYLKPSNTMITLFGTRRLGPGSLSVFGLYNFFIRTCRPHPMPHQLEAFKIAERAQINSRKLIAIMMLAAALGASMMFWLMLNEYYRFGADSGRFEVWTLGLGSEVFRQLQSWLYYPMDTDYVAISLMSAGLVFTMFLMFMRTTFLWWQLHPLGYVMANDWGMYNLWSCLLVSYIVKALILKHGGLRAYRRSVPFFMGLALGDYALGSLWSIAGIVSDTTIYQFFP